jgi:hypothetical protein
VEVSLLAFVIARSTHVDFVLHAFKSRLIKGKVRSLVQVPEN